MQHNQVHGQIFATFQLSCAAVYGTLEALLRQLMTFEHVVQQVLVFTAFQGAVPAHSGPIEGESLKASLHHGSQVFHQVVNTIRCAAQRIRLTTNTISRWIE